MAMTHNNATVKRFGNENTMPMFAEMVNGSWVELGAEIVDPMCARWYFDEPTRDRRVAVSVYACDKHYGGSEEGGWWYDTRRYTGYSERLRWEDEAGIDAAKERLLALFADEQPRYPLSSVCSDGPEYHAFVEAVAGEHDNHREPRPRYE